MKDPQVIQFYLSSAVAIIMLGMGLSLTIGDFIRVKDNPKSIVIGLVNQLILLPIIGFVLVKLFGLSNELAVGVMLIAACPGGPTSNLLSNLAKGDMGLSISLTAISSFITVITIPVIVSFSLKHFMDTNETITLDVLETGKKVLMVTIVPVSIGMLIKSKAPTFAAKMEKPVKIASAVLLAIIITGAFLANKDQLLDALPKVGPATIALNIITITLGFFSGKWFKLNHAQSTSIAIECGIQNGSLALFIGSMGVMANYTTILLAPATYGILMFATGGIAAFVLGKKSANN